MDWIDRNHISRRNLTKEQRNELMVRIYNRKKKAHGGDRKSEESKRQNDLLISEGKSTAEIVAAEFGVSPRTVERVVQQSAILEAHPEVQQAAIKAEADAARSAAAKVQHEVSNPMQAKRWSWNSLCHHHHLNHSTSPGFPWRRLQATAGRWGEIGTSARGGHG